LYIEISKGVSICIDKIESVEEDGMTSIVRTVTGTYKSTFPYQVLLQLLGEYNGEKEMQKEKREVEALNIFKEIGVFAG